MYRPLGAEPGYLTKGCKISGSDTKNGGAHGIGQSKSHTWKPAKTGVHVNGKISRSTLSNRLNCIPSSTNPYIEALTPNVTGIDRAFLEVIKVK